MTTRRVQYAIARSVYGQIRYAQAKPGGVPADIIGLGRHLSEIEGFYRVLISKPSLQRTETIIIELNRAPMNEKAFKRQIDHLIHRWAQDTLPGQANIIFETASQSIIERLEFGSPIQPSLSLQGTLNATQDKGEAHGPVSRPVAAPVRAQRKNTQPFPDQGGEAQSTGADATLRVPPSEPGRPINLVINDASRSRSASSLPEHPGLSGLHSDHFKILLEAIELMSELESGRLEALTDMARAGRIPSALRLKQEDRIRCILKADELIRKAKILLTGEGVIGKTSLDYILTPEKIDRAQALDAIKRRLQGVHYVLPSNKGASFAGNAADSEIDFDPMIDIDDESRAGARHRAGVLRPTRYTRTDVLCALEQLDATEN